MRLVITGCEYAGKTTLLRQINEWWKNATGSNSRAMIDYYHDHFTFYAGGSQMHAPPGLDMDVTEDELEKAKALGPVVREQIQRFAIDYHLSARAMEHRDWIVVGFHIEEAVYAPLYYGYGYPNKFGDRERFARYVEHKILKYFPGTVLVLVKASPETIAKRMRENPHHDNVIKEGEIEPLLKRFDEEYNKSLIHPKFVIDTTNRSPEETLNQFTKLMIPYFSQIDMLRVLHYQTFKSKT